MKRIILFVMAVMPSLFLFSQKVIENPKIGFTTASGLQLTKIELTDSFTILSFHASFSPGEKISIPKATYIQPLGDTVKYKVVKTEGIPLSKKFAMPESGTTDYSLFFPLIDTSVVKLDYGEANSGGNWFIYDIELKKHLTPSPVPVELLGKWYASDGSKLLKIALFDTLAVYGSKVWNYGKVSSSKNIVSIELKDSSQATSVFFTLVDSVTCKMGTSKKKMTELCAYPKEVNDFKISDDKLFKAPLFSEKTKATYSGFLPKFTTRAGKTTGMVYVNNVITGDQESYKVDIADNGYFTATFPLCYPEEVYVQMPFYYGAVFVVPGRETFQLIDLNEKKNAPLFMGENEMECNGLFEVDSINYFNYSEAMGKVLDMSPEDYKAYCFGARDRELKALDQFAQNHFISPKARQIKKNDIEYRALVDVLGYRYLYQSAYVKKNKIDTKKGMPDIEIPKPDLAWYNFITNDVVNNPLAVMSADYSSFIKRLKYCDVLRNENYDTDSLFLAYMETQRDYLTADEKLLIDKQKELEHTESSMLFKDFSVSNKDSIMALQTKYNEVLKSKSGTENFVIWYDLESALASEGISLTPSEKALIDKVKAIRSKDEFLVKIEFNKKNKEALDAIRQKYMDDIQEFVQKQNLSFRNQKMQEDLHLDLGLASDLMYSQDICRKIVREFTPAEESKLKEKLPGITTPFIVNYILAANEQTKQKIEESKKKTGYVVNETPTVESTALFDSIMAKYRGKAVFVDFWATWCSPCRMGIERMKPIKEQMAGMDVVFVYITNESSPKGTWDNMITDIKGEHYRVTQDQWNVLSERFHIRGIPHYVLVDKNGVVANNDKMPEHDADAMVQVLKKMLE